MVHFFHIKCAYHILNLIVKAGMEIDPIQNLIGKYKDALRYVDSSIKKNSILQSCAGLWVFKKQRSLRMSTLTGTTHTGC
jgi:hypothetical protein